MNDDLLINLAYSGSISNRELVKQLANIDDVEYDASMVRMWGDSVVYENDSFDFEEQSRTAQAAAEVQRIHDETVAAIKAQAAETMFPKAHEKIDNLDEIENIARRDLLNPLYEQVLKEYDDAKTAMSRAAHKLAAAVKLTDSEELNRRTKSSNSNTPQSLRAEDILKRIREKSWNAS